MPIDTPYTWAEMLIDLAIALAAWLAGWAVARFVGAWAARAAERSQTELDDLFIDVVRRALRWWALAAGLVLTVRIGATTAELTTWVDRAAMAIAVISTTLAVAHLLNGILERRVLPVGGVAGTTLVRKLVRWLVVVIGLLVLLNNLGFEITPLLAALGVGSLALGLALQPTLTNVFAGFNLSLGQRLRVGDIIRLEGGEEGAIADIGWRSTEIREMADNVILVPNSKLADMIVKNYSLPRGSFAAPVRVGVAYGSDLDFVERVAIEVAREVQRNVAGAVTDFDPVVRFLRFGESAIEMVVVARVESYTDQRTVEHELIKRIHARFRSEGIEIPFPQRVVLHRDAPAGGGSRETAD
jgi:small-conductance mechanosensitive channel